MISPYCHDQILIDLVVGLFASGSPVLEGAWKSARKFQKENNVGIDVHHVILQKGMNPSYSPYWEWLEPEAKELYDSIANG